MEDTPPPLGIAMILSFITLSLLVGSLLIGLLPALIDGINKPMQTRLELRSERAAWHVRLFYFSWLPAMPLAGWLLDELPGYSREILFFALVALILGIAWLALARSLLSLLVNALFVGAAYSLFTTTLIRLMTIALFAETNHAASLNVGFVAVGLGALLGPWLVRAIERWWGYRQGLLYFSIALIAPAALVALCERNLFPRPETDMLGWDDVLAHPHLAMIVAVILVFFAIENCLDFWPETYLQELGYQGRSVQINLIVFWLVFIAMRGVMAWWLHAHPTHAIGLTIGFVLLSALLLGNLASGYELGSGTFGFWVLGACYGPMLPCFLGIALNLYPQPVPTSALGALLALSGLDTLIVRPMMHVFAKDRPARVVMRVPTVLALVLAAPLLLMAFLR